MHESAPWAAVVGAVLTAILTFSKWLLPFLRDWTRARRDAKTIDGFARYQELYLALQAIEDAGIQRTIIFAGHNSGGIPKPGSPFYVSALHWMSEAPDRGGPAKYARLPVDAGYVAMLVDVMNCGEARFAPEDMGDCQLKSLYTAEGVEDSLLLFLGTRDKRLFYMSASTFYGKMNERQLTEIRLQANIIHNILTS